MDGAPLQQRRNDTLLNNGESDPGISDASLLNYSMCSGFELLLGVYKSHIIVVLFVVLEVASMVLDIVGETLGVLLSAFLLSAVGATINAYFHFGESPTAANLAQQHLKWTDVLLSVTQLINSVFQVTIRVLGHNKAYKMEFLFPLSFSILSAIFVFKNTRTTDSQTISITSTLNEIRVDLINRMDNLAVESTVPLEEQNITNTLAGDLSTVDSQPVEYTTPIKIKLDHSVREVDGLHKRHRGHTGLDDMVIKDIFHPSDKEIINILEKKMHNRNIDFPMIRELDDMCNYESSNLRELLQPAAPSEWRGYSFNPTVCRSNMRRITNEGQRKITCKPKAIYDDENEKIGKKRILVYYNGLVRCQDHLG